MPPLADMNIWQHSLNTKPGAVPGAGYAEAGNTGSPWLLRGAQAYPCLCQIPCGCPCYPTSSPGAPSGLPRGSHLIALQALVEVQPSLGDHPCPSLISVPVLSLTMETICTAYCMDVLFSSLYPTLVLSHPCIPPGLVLADWPGWRHRPDPWGQLCLESESILCLA